MKAKRLFTYAQAAGGCAPAILVHSQVPTRAQEAGVNANAYGRKVERFVDATRKRLQQIAYEWDEVDSSVGHWACNDLERALDEFSERVKESVERLKKPVDQE